MSDPEDDAVRDALEAMAHGNIRAVVAAMGEDPALVQRYLESASAGMRQKGLDRVRAAEARARRGPTPTTPNTVLRHYEPIPQKVQRAALHRAIERQCHLSSHAAMLLADLDTWGEVPVESSYLDALEELRRRGLAEVRLPLAQDLERRVRAKPTPFVHELMARVRDVLALDQERAAIAESAEPARAPRRPSRRAKPRRGGRRS